MDSHNRLSRDFVNLQKMRGSYVWVCGTVTGKLWVKMWVNVASRNEARLSTPLPRTPIRFGESPVCACTKIGDTALCKRFSQDRAHYSYTFANFSYARAYQFYVRGHYSCASTYQPYVRADYSYTKQIIPIGIPVHISYMPLYKLFLCLCTLFLCPRTLFICPCTLFLCQCTLLPRLCPTAQGLVSDTHRLSSPTPQQRPPPAPLTRVL